MDQPGSHLKHLRPGAPTMLAAERVAVRRASRFRRMARGDAGVHSAQPAGHRRAHARARLDRQRRRRRRDPDRRAARHRDHAEPAHRRHGALSGLDRDDDSVDRAVRRADPDPVEDRPGHRLPARGDRRDALRAAADHPQHLHGDPQRRPGAALGGDRHGHVDVAAAAARRDPDRAAGDHRRRADRGGHQHRRHRDRRVHRRRRPRHVHLPRHLADRHPAADHRRAGARPARDRRRLLAAVAAAAADAQGRRGARRTDAAE